MLAFHNDWHDGDGPLSKPITIRAAPYRSQITPAEAAEIAACNSFDAGIMTNCDEEIIPIAVHIDGDEYAWFDVVARMEVKFEARMGI